MHYLRQPRPGSRFLFTTSHTLRLSQLHQYNTRPSPSATFTPTTPNILRGSERRHRRNMRRSKTTTKCIVGFDTFFPALNVAPELAVLASAGLATGSVVINYFSGVQLERQRGEMALELERDKVFQTQLQELQGVIARYRGPLLESAIDLEQRLWHLITDQCFDSWGTNEERCKEEIRYLMFTLAQFLGFVEVVRREGPRERPFLQAGNPQGSDTLSTLIEGIRFILCASPITLETWFMEGPDRPHPGSRKRRSRTEVLQRVTETDVCPGAAPFLDPPLMRLSRGHQRAIGTKMIITPMGAERHYTMSYGDFHTRLDADPSFELWFANLRSETERLAQGETWKGEAPFPIGRWTRALLLQQLLVEVMDVLDPDCVRLSVARRQRLMPIKWGQLPSVSAYQKRLKELSGAADLGMHRAALEGLRDLVKGPTWEDPAPPASPLKLPRAVAEAAGTSTVATKNAALDAFGVNSDDE